MLKIRRPLGRLIFNMGIAIPGKTVFLIEKAPWKYISWYAMQVIAYIYLLSQLFDVQKIYHCDYKCIRSKAEIW